MEASAVCATRWPGATTRKRIVPRSIKQIVQQRGIARVMFEAPAERFRAALGVTALLGIAGQTVIGVGGTGMERECLALHLEECLHFVGVEFGGVFRP